MDQKLYLNDTIKPLCEEYGLQYLRCNHGTLNSIEVRLKDDFVFWIEGHTEQVRFSRRSC